MFSTYFFVCIKNVGACVTISMHPGGTKIK